jgi:hypothetical protein
MCYLIPFTSKKSHLHDFLQMHMLEHKLGLRAFSNLICQQPWLAVSKIKNTFEIVDSHDNLMYTKREGDHYNTAIINERKPTTRNCNMEVTMRPVSLLFRLHCFWEQGMTSTNTRHDNTCQLLFDVDFPYHYLNTYWGKPICHILRGLCIGLTSSCTLDTDIVTHTFEHISRTHCTFTTVLKEA